MVDFRSEYIAAGGNRHPSAADWDAASGLLAFGTDKNIALWSPLDDESPGVTALLHGHTDCVNAVKFFPTGSDEPQIILSGSVDKTIRVWRAQRASSAGFELAATLEDHASSINCLAVFKESNLVASGSADATIKIWRLDVRAQDVDTEHIQTIQTNPSFFPLALALHSLDAAEGLVLGAAGTKGIVQVYVASEDGKFCLQATLAGHEGWIRSLVISQERSSSDSDLFLASASQDKYIRLWRIMKVKDPRKIEDNRLGAAFEQSLCNKAHKLQIFHSSYAISFEALLLGHEDWIYTISWRLDDGRLRLLSASADNSLAIWKPEESSGIWVCTTRLGEISVQKGSTTATGSTGGFWIGLWSPNGKSVVSLGRTGGWRLWKYDDHESRWAQGISISGHTKPVTDIAWANDGSFLLSTGSDQTTRMHASWKRGSKRSWHEMARPQIHGYDLNCIDTIGQTRFISGADEKLLRIFDEPRATASLLDRLCGVHFNAEQELPDTADIPVLGLSNKAIESTETEEGPVVGDGGDGLGRITTTLTKLETSNLEHPPFENQLARYTLWPETEKLYGHGYEISAVATSHDGTLVATSCRATSLKHAVIRLYTTRDWREVKPPLTAHTLTVTALRFSGDDKYLLSVGRDRQWAVFERDSDRSDNYLLKHLNSKGHSRMILNACWAPVEAGRIFATAGRDKTIRVWRMNNVDTECIAAIILASPVTAIDISPRLVQDSLIIASGTELGCVSLHILQLTDWSVMRICELEKSRQPSKSVTQLAWRPISAQAVVDGKEERAFQLAVASDDSSLRLFSVSGLAQEEGNN